MGELEEYHQNLMTDIRREADVSGILMVEAFFDRMAERLTEAGELETTDRSFFQIGDGADDMQSEPAGEHRNEAAAPSRGPAAKLKSLPRAA